MVEFLIFFFIAAGLFGVWSASRANQMLRRKGMSEKSLPWAFFKTGFLATLVFLVFVVGLFFAALTMT